MSTVTITAADINKLRQSTGAGMMDCRKALTETNGDFEAAIDWLRKGGADGDRDSANYANTKGARHVRGVDTEQLQITKQVWLSA